jgi:hypothetical protein
MNMTSLMLRLVSKIRGLFGQKEADSEFDLETQTHLPTANRVVHPPGHGSKGCMNCRSPSVR